MGDYYFDGDPEVNSTRRQLERVLQGRPRRRWPWVVAALAGGGAAIAFWRIHAHRAGQRQTAPDDAPATKPELHQVGRPAGIHAGRR